MKMYLFATAILMLSLTVMADSFGQEKGRPRMQNVTGIVSKVDATSLTVTQRGDGGDRSTTFTVDAKTKILVQTKDDVITKGEGGRERKTPKTAEGKIGDVKVDQRVAVGFVEAGKAASILVLRPTPPRKGEGER